jgi:hypothetical protein
MEEPLYAYTMGGAILSGDDDNRGSITPGKWADLAVLSGDPHATPTEDLLTLVVEQTYVGDTCKYRRDASGDDLARATRSRETFFTAIIPMTVRGRLLCAGAGDRAGRLYGRRNRFADGSITCK